MPLHQEHDGRDDARTLFNAAACGAEGYLLALVDEGVDVDRPEYKRALSRVVENLGVRYPAKQETVSGDEAMPMAINTCQFVLASELFSGFEALWDEVTDSAPDASWGSNNRSLVTTDAIIDHLDACGEVDEDDLEMLRQRVAELGEGLYVDLEN